MRFMLLQAYGGVELEGCVPMDQWAPDDVRAHIEFQQRLNVELLESGELVDAQGLAGPEAAKFVVSDGVNPPKIIDGPYRSPRSCWPAIGWSTSTISSGHSRSRPVRRRPPARAGWRSGRRSRSARCWAHPTPRCEPGRRRRPAARARSQALGVVARRYGGFADAEDAIQEALLAATKQWPTGLPDEPLAWLVTVASRRLVDEYRRTDARRRREELAAALSVHPEPTEPARDDSLVLLFLCCDDSLSPTLAIPLTLRAVAGLTTREIAAAYLVPEATIAQRISRAKAKLRGRRFELPADPAARVPSVCAVLYLLFNEGYTSSAGPELTRVDLSGDAIRLARLLHARLPAEPEVAGLLALMLLTEARRPARTAADGSLVALAAQDRTRWDPTLIGAGLALLNSTLAFGRIGEYQLLAAIAALHDEAPSSGSTRWAEVAATYAKLESLTGNPVVRLNRAVAVAMVDGPAAGLALLDGLDLRDWHRLPAVRGHLLEQAGQLAAAAECYRVAAARASNLRERDYLVEQAARLHRG